MSMVIDAREIELRELFLKLKDLLGCSMNNEVSFEVFVRDAGDSKKVVAFASMSGCTTAISRKNDYYVVSITGFVCCA
jgi:hypothetical protein